MKIEDYIKELNYRFREMPESIRERHESDLRQERLAIRQQCNGKALDSGVFHQRIDPAFLGIALFIPEKSFGKQRAHRTQQIKRSRSRHNPDNRAGSSCGVHAAHDGIGHRVSG